MRPQIPYGISALLPLAMVPAARADITYVSQDRSVEVTTTANATTLTESAPDFGPFVTTLTSTTTFPSPTGPAPNTGTTTIDCQLDPNAIRASGSLTGAGGLNINGNLEAGEAEAFVFVVFTLAGATPFQLFATPRPSNDPRDEWEIELENVSTGNPVFRIDETAPPQSVDVNGVLQPGTYSLQFQVEMTVETPETTRSFDFRFLVPAPAGAAAFLLAPAVALRRRR